jgi:lysosomal acid lipase/cholesteryl ester hydrolase
MNKAYLLFLAVGIAAAFPNRLQESKNGEGEDPEITMTVPEIIRYWGYPCEVHHVTTSDGYILEMHRIPHGLSNVKATNGPIFLQHGLFSSSADWVLNIGSENLGFMLADAGYDVWLGNIRGNRYSRKHTSLDPDKDHAFWQFSWDEMAAYDVPAMIDYTLAQTDQKTIQYMGFSMGTTMAFALLSESPEYNEKISAFFAMAPVAHASHMKGPVRILAPLIKEEEAIIEILGQDELLPNNKLMEILGDTLCRVAPKLACENIIFLIAGYDADQMNATRLPVYVAHTPAGTSVQNLVHFAQIINSGNFQKFDYGAEGNVEKYGKLTPPIYDLTKITTKVALFWGENDLFADKDDVAKLAEDLKDVLKTDYRVPYDKFTHLDFQWALNAKSVLYEQVIELLPIIKTL